MNKKEEIKELWDAIALFEENEEESWKDANPVQQEARAQARMEAYVRLFELMTEE